MNHTFAYQFRFRLFALLIVPTLALLAGCGETLVKVNPVSGKVDYQGKPPAGAQIVLHALGDNKIKDVPSGKVQEDGTFKISTYQPDDGAPAGEYAATIQWQKMVTDAGGSGPGPNVLPATYAKPETSPIKITVQDGPNEVPPIVVK